MCDTNENNKEEILESIDEKLMNDAIVEVVAEENDATPGDSRMDDLAALCAGEDVPENLSHVIIGLAKEVDDAHEKAVIYKKTINDLMSRLAYVETVLKAKISKKINLTDKEKKITKKEKLYNKIEECIMFKAFNTAFITCVISVFLTIGVYSWVIKPINENTSVYQDADGCTTIGQINNKTAAFLSEMPMQRIVPDVIIPGLYIATSGDDLYTLEITHIKEDEYAVLVSSYEISWIYGGKMTESHCRFVCTLNENKSILLSKNSDIMFSLVNDPSKENFVKMSVLTDNDIYDKLHLYQNYEFICIYHDIMSPEEDI